MDIIPEYFLRCSYDVRVAHGFLPLLYLCEEDLKYRQLEFYLTFYSVESN